MICTRCRMAITLAIIYLNMGVYVYVHIYDTYIHGCIIRDARISSSVTARFDIHKPRYF